MGVNESPVNACFIIDSRLYMKSGSNSIKYVTIANPLKIAGFND